MSGGDLPLSTDLGVLETHLRPRPMWHASVVGLAWLLAVASAIGQWFFQATAATDGALAQVLEPSDSTGALLSIAVGTVGAIVVLRGPARGYGWIMLSTGSMVGLIGFASHYSVYGQDVDVPFVTAATWVQDLWMITFLGLFLMTALFPDGSVASDRWRRPVKWLTMAWAVFIFVFTLTEREVSGFFADPGIEGYLEELPQSVTGFLAIPVTVLTPIWILLMLASIVIGLGSLITRWRRAGTEMKARLKWVLYAFSLFLGVIALDQANQALTGVGLDLGLRPAINLLVSGAQVGLVVAFGFGVLKYRLYDVDLVINRTIVYGLLTVMIVATYVAVVLGVGSLIAVEQSALALLVTAVVAVAFAPVRSWVQGLVNRLMFGQRDDPYAVLAEMGRLLARSGQPQGTLQALVETVARSLKLPGCSIEIEEDGQWREWASYGEERGNATNRKAVPVRHQGEVVGRLTATPRSPNERLSRDDLELLEDVARQAGALVRSVRLTMALQRSRERLVVAQEEERRRIRHDLHDELGPSLASQTLQLDSILERIEDDPERASELVADLKSQNQQLVSDIRRLVHELRPPALDELGVAGALSAQTSQMQRSSALTIDLDTVPDPLPELPAAVEVAAYRIAREAIVNTVRHAEARECITTLEATNSYLIVTVADDGVGIDRTTRRGVGLTSMRERTEELGGTFEVVSAEARGTQVVARLPLVNGGAPGSAGIQ